MDDVKKKEVTYLSFICLSSRCAALAETDGRMFVPGGVVLLNGKGQVDARWQVIVCRLMRADRLEIVETFM